MSSEEKAAPAAAAAAGGDNNKGKGKGGGKGKGKDGGGKKEKSQGVEKFKAAEPFVNDTPAGHKKDMTKPMASSYHPQAVEAAWNDWWEGQNLYKPQGDASKGKFVIMIPPPNVTGRLHIGHALTVAIEDCLVRWHRMNGRQTLWVPGTDHAGIATQVVVEKNIKKLMGKTRQELGREDFLKEVWKWKGENAGFIQGQLRRMGCSVDWSREVFTMDEMRARAVTEAFVQIHEKGLIYRANRLVNWSCALRTAISTIEVEFIDVDEPKLLKVPNHDEKVEFGVIHSFAYAIAEEDGGGEIVVATTRIETMLGDTGVCVHPDDDRYKHLHGKTVKHPFITDRKIPIITDAELVDMEFGTGAVKITPAHDPNDFECGKRHDLEQINIFDDDGLINANGGEEFQGMKRFECRTAIIKALDAKGLFRGKATNKMRLGLCSRSGDVIEPVLRPQWWMNCQDLAARSVRAVREKELKISPEFHESTWFNWLENIQEWCVSRQLWWGHRIPAYLIVMDGEDAGALSLDGDRWVVARTPEAAKEQALEKFPAMKDTPDKLRLEQDPDVLDTWFSSGLFPFSVFNWPEKTMDLEKFFPGHLLETGHDILFFWVARMVMMSLCLTDKLPFDTVYLHAMVRDKSGKKMSKSLGNVIDPLDVVVGCSLEDLHTKLESGNLDPREVERAKKLQKTDFPGGIAECGADALRFGLLAYTLQGRDVNLDIQRVVAYRQFCNKLWNVISFARMYYAGDWQRPGQDDSTLLPAITARVDKEGSYIDKWILSRFAYMVRAVNESLSGFEFAHAVSALHDFWLHKLCDVYLEAIKPHVQHEGTEHRACVLDVLYVCLELGLRALHPFMPFLTEELYHRLPSRDAANADRTHAEPVKDANDMNGMPNHECGSIMITAYPTTAMTDVWYSEEVETIIDELQGIAGAARSLRASVGITKAKLDVYVSVPETSPWTPRLQKAIDDVKTLSQGKSVTIVHSQDAIPDGCVSQALPNDITLSLMVKGLIDYNKELTKINKQIGQHQVQADALKAKMDIPVYAEKTPEDQKEKDQTKCDDLQAKIDTLSQSVERFLSMMTKDERIALYECNIASIESEIAKAEKSLKKVVGDTPREDLSKKALKFAERDEALIAGAKERLAKEKEALEKAKA